MTAVCYTPFKIPRVRVTQLNSCGVPVTGCSTVVSDGTISVAITKNNEARQEFFVKNGDGNFCVRETNPSILKYLTIVYTFCNVDPELYNIISGEPLVLNDAASPASTGWSTQEGSAANVNFALEGWTRLANPSTALCTGGPEFGYFLVPWNVEGMIGDFTYQNDTISFTVSTRSRAGSGWGLGPYFVDYSDNPAGSTNGIPLLTPIGATQHMRTFLTRLPPPAASCGCQQLSTLTPH